jgi:membrane protein
LTSVWVNSGEDNIFFLASGVAFNILLAFVPFVLLLVSGLGYFLDLSPAASLSRISVLVDRLLPAESSRMGGVIMALMNEAIRVRGTVGIVSAVTFLWFSTRLFGSLRAVLALVFDLDRDRGIVDGKIFDAASRSWLTLACSTRR